MARDMDRELVRITFNLSTRSSKALDSIMETTHDTKTEILNKALQVYALIEKAQSQGGEITIKDDPASSPVRIRFY